MGGRFVCGAVVVVFLRLSFALVLWGFVSRWGAIVVGGGWGGGPLAQGGARGVMPPYRLGGMQRSSSREDHRAERRA